VDAKLSASSTAAATNTTFPVPVTGSVPCPFPSDLVPGDILTGATVCRVEPKIGVFLEVKSRIEHTPAFAYAHVSRVSDNRDINLTKVFAVGSEHTCRVILLHRLDGLVHVSMQQSVLKQPILWYEDVKPGMLVDAEVLSLQSFGALVKLAPNVRAIIPTVHLSDVELTKVSKAKKFAVGKTVKCRVLTVDYVQKKVALTAKKTLVGSTLPIISTYDQAQKGMIVHGAVTNAKDYGTRCSLHKLA
jgi:rRNA biogenesis protein RRP5